MTRPLRIAPSILASDFSKLAEEVRSVEAAGADWIHLDVMDGHFVPVITIEPVIDMVDLVLVMSVNPGWGGQKFIPAAEDKIRRVAALAGGRPIDIEVDGGVTPENTELVTRAGANALVAGSAVFKGGPGAYRANIAAIRQA